MDRGLRSELDRMVKHNFVFAFAFFVAMVLLIRNPIRPIFPPGHCAPGSTATFSVFLFTGLTFCSFLLMALLSLSLKYGVLSGQLRQEQAWIASDRVSLTGTYFGFIFFMLAFMNMTQIQVGRFGCSRDTEEELAEALVYLVYPAMFLGISAVVYNFLFC